jgi:hypothetical protein
VGRLILVGGNQGLYWKVEEGKEVKLSSQAIAGIMEAVRELASLISRARELERELEEIEEKARPFRERIIKFAQKHEGWRGLVDRSGNLNVTVTCRKRWKAEVIQRWLKKHYFSCIEGRLKIDLRFPLKGKGGEPLSSSRIIAAIEKALIELGVSPGESIFVLPPEEVVDELRENVIKELQDQGKIEPMPSDAAELQWVISIQPWKRG